MSDRAEELLKRWLDIDERACRVTKEECDAIASDTRAYLNEKPHESPAEESEFGPVLLGEPDRIERAPPPHAAAERGDSEMRTLKKFTAMATNEVHPACKDGETHVVMGEPHCIKCGYTFRTEKLPSRAAAEPEKPVAWMYRSVEGAFLTTERRPADGHWTETPLYASPAVPPHSPTHRWNVEPIDGGLRVCRGGHQSAEPCEWEYFVPKAAG